MQDEEDDDEGGEGGEEPGTGEVRTGADADAGEDAREEGLHPQASPHPETLNPYKLEMRTPARKHARGGAAPAHNAPRPAALSPSLDGMQWSGTRQGPVRGPGRSDIPTGSCLAIPGGSGCRVWVVHAVLCPGGGCSIQLDFLTGSCRTGLSLLPRRCPHGMQEVDAYWLQRRIARAFGDLDADTAQKLAEEVLSTLQARVGAAWPLGLHLNVCLGTLLCREFCT